MLKAIIFDVDGVLVDSRAANLKFYKQLIAKAGYPVPSDEIIQNRFHMSLVPMLEEVLQLEDPEELERICNLANSPEIRGNELNKYPTELRADLVRLHRRYKLAIVTGRRRFGLDEILDQAAIGGVFDVTVTYEDYHRPKPHPEPLLVALDRLGVPADEAIYIGDSYTDIEAAREAGMRSIHLTSNAHPDATVVVREFKELLAAIQSLE